MVATGDGLIEDKTSAPAAVQRAVMDPGGGDRGDSLLGLNAGGGGGADWASCICARSMTARADLVREPLSFDDGGYVTAQQVFAYLDPGSGSLIVQLLVGGVAALGVSVKMFWGRILSFLRIRRDEEESPVQQDTRS